MVNKSNLKSETPFIVIHTRGNIKTVESWSFPQREDNSSSPLRITFRLAGRKNNEKRNLSRLANIIGAIENKIEGKDKKGGGKRETKEDEMIIRWAEHKARVER
jgi:hypothetical protein